MDTSDTNDEMSCEDRDISIEEFWRTEILGSIKLVNDVNLIANSNRNLQYSTALAEFNKFTDYIMRPLYSDDYGSLWIPTFRILYLLLLRNKGKSEALKFFASSNNIFPPLVDDLLQYETCEDAENLLKSQSRITVEITKRAYRSLLNWIKGNFKEKSSMINILRVLHEYFHFDIQKDKGIFIDEKLIDDEMNFWIPLKPEENSEDKTKASSENNVQDDEMEGDQKKDEPGANKLSENNSYGYLELDSSLFVLKEKARKYLEKVRNSGLTLEEVMEAVLSPPKDENWHDNGMDSPD